MTIAMSLADYERDKFGFYRVGNLKFYSKIEAIEIHTKTGIHPHWDFNESVFSMYDWTKEPTESLEELYRQRAQQLREKYDYLVLWYSSGADSDNILKSFLDNNIPLDEVASFVNDEGTHDKDNYYMNGEIYNIAHKVVSGYKEKFPDLIHRIVDLCKPVVDFFSTPGEVLDWRYQMNCMFNPNATMRGKLYRYVKEWQDLKNSGKKIGFIWGIDKPRLGLENNRYYVKFLDVVDNAVNPEWQMNRDPGDFNELFYWTPDMPELVIKQAHTIKKFLRSDIEGGDYLRNEASHLAYKIKPDGKKLWLTTLGVNYLIYPKYHFDPLNEFKPSSLFWTQRDQWFYNIGKSDTSYTNWQSALSSMWKDVPDYWKNDPTDPSRAFKGCVSKPYFLE
jgi:hypothetical protein